MVARAAVARAAHVHVQMIAHAIFAQGKMQGPVVWVIDRTLAVWTTTLTIIAAPTLLVPTKHPQAKKLQAALAYFIPYRCCASPVLLL